MKKIKTLFALLAIALCTATFVSYASGISGSASSIEEGTAELSEGHDEIDEITEIGPPTEHGEFMEHAEDEGEIDAAEEEGEEEEG